MGGNVWERVKSHPAERSTLLDEPVHAITASSLKGKADLTIYFFDDPWRNQAACKGARQGVFFPERGESTREAQQCCTECEVRIECLTHAISVNERFGIWGGLPERARRRVKHLVAEGWETEAALLRVENERQHKRTNPNTKPPEGVGGFR